MNSLSNKDKNLLIAKSCGDYDRWLVIKDGYYYRPNSCGYTMLLSEAGFYTEEQARIKEKHGFDCGVIIQRAPIPDYFKDSAAIRKAKLFLRGEQRGYFVDHLANICRENSDGPATSIGKAFFATCEQEAEALGLTLNLWSGGLFEQKP